MALPNILYIHSHDTGRYIQPYGHPVSTPNLQRLAEGGVLFRQAFSAAPTCSPSRAALLTGQSPHSSGMLGLAHRGFALDDYGQHIVHTLRTAGYYSALAGVQHVARDPSRIGYDAILGGEAESEEAACDFLNRPTPQPFFLSAGFFETHRYDQREAGAFTREGPGGDARYRLPPAPLPDTPQIRQDMAGFAAAAWILDDKIGRVLDALEANGLAGNTLVICTTDHGIPFPGMKGSLTDHGVGVMLIVRGPGGFTGGKVCDAMVSQIDIFPTICDLIGLERPAWLQGRSMLPLIRGEAEEINEEIFAEVTYHAAHDPQRAARTRRWKYIRRFDDRDRPVLPNVDDSPSKDLWLRHGWGERPIASEQLYDLIFDPAEACNLAGEPAYTGPFIEMRDRLDRWMRATDDPLLRGPVPPPSGALLNDPDGLSPGETPRAVS